MYIYIDSIKNIFSKTDLNLSENDLHTVFAKFKINLDRVIKLIALYIFRIKYF